MVPLEITETGAVATTDLVYTGVATSGDGTSAAPFNELGNAIEAMQASEAVTGLVWITLITLTGNTFPLAMYAMSDPITVPKTVPSIGHAGALLLAGVVAATGARATRRR